MKKALKLPKFDVPDLPPKRMTTDEYHAWVMRNLKILWKSGQLARIRKDPNRMPVKARFVL